MDRPRGDDRFRIRQSGCRWRGRRGGHICLLRGFEFEFSDLQLVLTITGTLTDRTQQTEADTLTLQMTVGRNAFLSDGDLLLKFFI